MGQKAASGTEEEENGDISVEGRSGREVSKEMAVESRGWECVGGRQYSCSAPGHDI